MIFEHNSPAAEANPRIRAFVEAVVAVAGDGVFTQSQFQHRDFIKFWPHSVITRYDAARDDFVFVLVGGELVLTGGRDITGKYLGDGYFATTEDDLRKFNADVIREKRTIYCSGTIDIPDNDYKWWHQVKIPFEMNGRQIQTLGYTIFEVE